MPHPKLDSLYNNIWKITKTLQKKCFGSYFEYGMMAEGLTSRQDKGIGYRTLSSERLCVAHRILMHAGVLSRGRLSRYPTPDGWAWPLGIARFKRRMASDKSIQQLFTLARNGDETAKNELFSILRVRIFNLAKYRMASLEVGDLVQEVLVTFFEKFHQIESETKVLPFLFAILSHKLGNWYQKAQGLREEVPIELITAQYAKVAGGGDPEEIFGAAELESILRQALMIVQRRSPESAKVFRCLLQGYSMDETKKELGIKNLNTVYVKINRARKMLRAILKKEFNLEV